MIVTIPGIAVILTAIAMLGGLVFAAVKVGRWIEGQFTLTRHASYNAIAQARVDLERRLDNHGKRIRQLELREAARGGVAAIPPHRDDPGDDE